MLQTVSTWLQASWYGQVMRDVPWLFPIFEGLHFVGMALLFGSIALIDLRVLGFAKGLPLGPLHRLLPLAFGGFALNLITGIGFFASDPQSYAIVPAFKFKMLLILLAGLNALVFWIAILPKVHDWNADVEASRLAKGISLASLLLWVGVITAGRFIAFAGTGTL
jgi:hypothetical protein